MSDEPKRKEKKKSKSKEATREEDVDGKIRELKTRLKADYELMEKCEKKQIELNSKMENSLERSSILKIDTTKEKLNSHIDRIDKEIDRLTFNVTKELKDCQERLQKIADINDEGDKELMDIKRMLEYMRVQNQSTIGWLFERSHNAVTGILSPPLNWFRYLALRSSSILQKVQSGGSAEELPVAIPRTPPKEKQVSG